MGLFENPNTWGSSSWVLLHCVSMTFPKTPTTKEINDYAAFFKSLKNVLPCKICRKSYTVWLKDHPPYFSSRKEAIHWVIDVHNYVNVRLGKKKYPKRQALKEINLMCNKK